MQYESPAKLKHLDKMTEVQWTDELRDRAAGYLTELMESVQTPTEVDDALLTVAVVTQAELDAAVRDTEIDAYFDDLKARDPKALDAMQAEAHAGTVLVEFGQLLSGGGMQVFPDDANIEAIYPLGKRIFHTMRYGGEVYRRRVIVVEEWTRVDESDPTVQEALKVFSEKKVDLAPKGIELP
jgi:hypothetical protein